MQTIARADLDGSDVEVIVDSGTLGPYYMDLDREADHLYWTDYGTSEIRRANLVGSAQMVLIDTYPGWPVGIALDLFHGKVYWTLLGGAIQRANLDVGFNCSQGGGRRAPPAGIACHARWAPDLPRGLAGESDRRSSPGAARRRRPPAW